MALQGYTTCHASSGIQTHHSSTCPGQGSHQTAGALTHLATMTRTNCIKTSFEIIHSSFNKCKCCQIVACILFMQWSWEHPFNPYWTVRTYMSLPGKGLKGHVCPTIVTPWWHHSDVMNLVVQQILLHCGQGTMSSWTMVNNVENWQLKRLV